MIGKVGLIEEDVGMQVAVADMTRDDYQELSLSRCVLDAPGHLGDGLSWSGAVAGVAEKSLRGGQHIPVADDGLEFFCHSSFDYLSRLQSL